MRLLNFTVVRLITKIYSVHCSDSLRVCRSVSFLFRDSSGSYSEIYTDIGCYHCECVFFLCLLLLLSLFSFYFRIIVCVSVCYMRVGSHQNYNKVGKCSSSCLLKVMILNPDDTESFCVSLLTADAFQ